MGDIPDGVWNVDPQRSEIGFAVRDMWGLRTVRGVFRAYDGSLHTRAGELTIEAASLDTGDARRDRHLRSPAFFDVEHHPRIVFSATAVTETITGELTIGSARVPLEIPVDVEHTADDTVRVEASTTVSRKSAGLDWNMLGMIRGDAALHARLTLVR